MGTRADFYIGRGKDAEWLGSIAWDGYPGGIPQSIRIADSEKGFRSEVSKFLDSSDDATLPNHGWPWPWNDSRTTDFSYTYDDNVFASCFGYQWFPFDADGNWLVPDEEEWGDEKAEFPEMTDVKNVTMGKRSGVIMVQVQRR